jgi:hypothetical protein
MHDWHEFCGDGGPDVTIGLRRPYKSACPITEIGNDVWIGQGLSGGGTLLGPGAVGD